MSELYKKLVGSHLKQAQAILKLKDTFATSWWLSLDPGSNSCGYALWYGLELVDSGSIQAKGSIGKRLSNIQQQFEAVLTTHQAKPEVAVVEFVRSNTGHIYLTWAAGALVATSKATHTLEISTGLWSKVKTAAYVKGDEADAFGIGTLVCTLLAENTTVKRRKNAKHPKLRAARNHAKRQPGRNTA